MEEQRTCGKGLAEHSVIPSKIVQAFEKFVPVEKELLALLRTAEERDEQMLAEMRHAHS